jgi:metacaspase-1
MARPISVLCVHGVGHGDVDPDLEATWTKAISDGLTAWDPGLQDAVACDFLKYDPLFEKAPLNPVTYAHAFASTLASGVVHGIGDLFTRERGLLEVPDKVRWTAGMVAQWVSEDKLRENACNMVLAKLEAGNYKVVCAHSLGSLICYDTFLMNPQAVRGRYFVSLGSQIGNPLVRNVFAGRLEPLAGAKMWFHLFNPDDHVFTADIRLSAGNFEEVGTRFDVPNDILNHDATWYLNHQNTRATVWRAISGAKVPRALSRGMETFRALSAKPTRRALLVGINDYPDAANRLEGCVNDVFLMSSVLQESGFDSQDIRVVLNERATAAGILDRLHWLLDDVRAGDERVLFYSGHGAQMPVYGASDEVDHMDECLVPYDFDWTPQHAVTDKQFVNFYSQLPYDSYFAAIFDCCHSGGMTREGGRRVRGITPPDDIRHRALRWNAELQMWEDRPLVSPNPSLMKDKEGENYLGASGATYRIGRAVGLRALPQKQYDAVRRDTKHNGPYLPVIMEACQEDQLSYEYRHGVQSYGAFSFSLAATLRASRGRKVNPTFIQLMDGVGARLRHLKYDQTPNLVGAAKVLHQPVPWTGKPAATAGSSRRGRSRKSRGGK